MMIYIGSDHAGFPLKELLQKYLKSVEGRVKDVELVDCGTFSEDSVDYPDIAKEVSLKVLGSEGALGILICGTGIGMSISANKVDGIRAAHVTDSTQARFARLHNDANVVCLGQRITGSEVAKDIVDTFLSTDFEGGRHANRVQKIKDLENGK
ncbi:MAG: ribose 5-phosphate isomerase B [Candidatus Gracilibacteria bacterium]